MKLIRIKFTSYLKRILGWLHLLPFADRARREYYQLRYYQANRRFRNTHSDVPLPDDAFLYETFKLNYAAYHFSGIQTAKWLLSIYQECSATAPASILDWGCGPARVVQHMPKLAPQAKVLGADYNAEMINWCKMHFSNIRFLTNDLTPPLAIDSQSIHFAYAISVFTHLSEDRHLAWMAEMHRILAPKGVLVFTTHGAAFVPMLNKVERWDFEGGKLITRPNDEEGKRIFTTFHPATFVESESRGFNVLKHVPGRLDDKTPQDVWIFEKTDHVLH